MLIQDTTAGASPPLRDAAPGMRRFADPGAPRARRPHELIDDGQVIRTAARRWAQLLLGVLLAAAGSGLMIRSGLGLGPWDALILGLHRTTGVSIGAASAGVSVVLLLAGTRLGAELRWGTIVVPLTTAGGISGVLAILPPLSAGVPWAVPVGYLLLGIGAVGTGTGVYLAAELGTGPRDALMLALVRRTGWSVPWARGCMELSAVGAGWALGGSVGVGTVVFAATVGVVVAWAIRQFRPPSLSGRIASDALQRERRSLDPGVVLGTHSRRRE